MQAINKLIMTLMLCIVMVFSVVSLQAVETPPAEITQAAEAGLKVFLPKAGESLTDCPFKVTTLEEANQATVDFGFRLYTVNPKVLANPGGKRLSSMVEPTSTWRFVVVSNGNPIGLLTVSQVNGQWQAVAAGAAELADEVYQVRKAWPKKDGFNFRFVRIFQAVSDFMEISTSKASLGFVPMKAARVSLQEGSMDLRPDALMYESELLEPLSNMVKNSMKRFSKDASVADEK